MDKNKLIIHKGLGLIFLCLFFWGNGYAENGYFEVPEIKEQKEYEIIDYKLISTGVDIATVAGESFASPIDGVIRRLEYDINSIWEGVVIEGEGRFAGVTLRLLGIKPALQVGEKVQVGDDLGVTLDPGKDFEGVRPYVQIEYYLNGKRADAKIFVGQYMPEATVFEHHYEHMQLSIHAVLYKDARRLERNRHPEMAVLKYKESMNYPVWKRPNTYVYRNIALAYAHQGEYQQAIEYQELYLAFLQLELAYTRGQLPDADLGVIASITSVDTVNKKIFDANRLMHFYQERRDRL